MIIKEETIYLTKESKASIGNNAIATMRMEMFDVLISSGIKADAAGSLSTRAARNAMKKFKGVKLAEFSA